MATERKKSKTAGFTLFKGVKKVSTIGKKQFEGKK